MYKHQSFLSKSSYLTYTIILFICSIIFLVTETVVARSAVLLGDNLLAGYAAHPDFSRQNTEAATLLKPSLSAISKPSTYHLHNALLAPTLLPPSGVVDYTGSASWVLRNVLFHLHTRYANTAEYSFGYLVANFFQAKGKDIIFSTENNVHSSNLGKQVDRVLRHLSYLPPHLTMVFFAGSELCGRRLEELTPVDVFARNLEQGLKYMVRNSQPADGYQPVVVIPAFLDTTQLLRVDSILDKKVTFASKMMTCREFRAQPMIVPPTSNTMTTDPLSLLVAKVVIQNPALYCPTLFTAFTDAQKRDERLTFLANRIRGYRSAQKKTVTQLQAWAAEKYRQQRFRFVYLEDTAALEFKGEDIADDCLHLSVPGHQKVANKIIANLKGFF